MNHPDPTADPEDVFRDTRMSFGEHIEELRSHMLRAIYGFVIGMVVALRQAPPRILPVQEVHAGKTVPFLLTSIPNEGYNRARITLEALCSKLGIYSTSRPCR